MAEAQDEMYSIGENDLFLHLSPNRARGIIVSILSREQQLEFFLYPRETKELHNWLTAYLDEGRTV